MARPRCDSRSSSKPMAGMKASGLGRRHGEHRILRYTEPQTIAIERGLPVGAPPRMSADHYARVMSGGLRVLRSLPSVK